MTVSEIKKYIDETVRAYESIKVLVLTGGECFLYGKKLEEIIAHASSFGLITRVVTNGFWANDYDKAYEKTDRLAKAGLNEINFSTGDDHLEYVSIQSIKNGIIASIKHNLTTVVNVESNSDRVFNSKYLLNDDDVKEFIHAGQLKVISGIWMPFTLSTLENMSHKDKENQILVESYRRCTNIFNTITIDPNHRMVACCGLTSKYIKYLDLGNVSKYSIKELYDNQFDDFLKIWIATEGTHKIMDFISQYETIKFDYAKIHACQVCAMIFNNPEFLEIIQREYKSIYTNVILKYIFNKKQMNHENSK